jgi:hypothetical protein
VNTFMGLILLTCGLPALAASCAALRVAQGRAETRVAAMAWLLCLTAVVGGGLLLA